MSEFRFFGSDEDMAGRDLGLAFGPFSGDPQVEVEFQKWRTDYLSGRDTLPNPSSAGSELTTDEEVALAIAAFYDRGYDGHIPTYAQEQLAYLEEKRLESPAEDSGQPSAE